MRVGSKVSSLLSVLTRIDVSFTSSGAVLWVYRTKTIQFSQRVVEIPLLFIPNSMLCSVSSLLSYFRLRVASSLSVASPSGGGGGWGVGVGQPTGI